MIYVLNKSAHFVVESVRKDVQPNWPDAEKGVPKGQQDRRCTVLTNYLDKGNNPFENQSYNHKYMSIIF